MKQRGRALWPMVLLLATAMVVTDFVRHPFRGAPPGDAAGGARDLAIWVAGTDAGTTPARLARGAARRLDRPGAAARARTAPGGTSAAVLALLDDEPGSEDAVLLVHAGTLADLERERRDVELPGVPAEAARAQRLLRAAAPVALLADDTLLVAARRDAGPRSAGALLASLRRAPGRLVFGVGIDAWSKASLAALVSAAGTPGRVPYRVLPNAGEAGLADSSDGVDVVVAPASELRGGALSDRLRPLAQSDRGPALDAAGAVRPTDVRAATGRAARPLPTFGALLSPGTPVARTHRWVALVAPPTLHGARRTALTRRVERLVADPGWRRLLRRNGLGPPPRGPLGARLALAWRETGALVSAATRVDRLGSPARR